MTTKTGITHAELKTEQRAVREGFPQTMSLRVHRAISWIGRAEACGADADARFIFCGSHSTPHMRKPAGAGMALCAIFFIGFLRGALPRQNQTGADEREELDHVSHPLS